MKDYKNEPCKQVKHETAITQTFTEIKKKLNDVPVRLRDVYYWNAFREDCKGQYDTRAIYMLDSSGLITKWLKGESI